MVQHSTAQHSRPHFDRVSDNVDVLAVGSEAAGCSVLEQVGFEGTEVARLRGIEVFVAVHVMQLHERDDHADLVKREVASSAKAL